MPRAPPKDLAQQMLSPPDCFPIVSGVFFVAVYAMCFAGLFATNTELVSVGLLLALSAMAVFYVVRGSLESAGGAIHFLPTVVAESLASMTPVSGAWIGTARYATALGAAGAMLVASLAVLLAAFARVRDHAMADGASAEMDFGNKRATVEALKVGLATGSALLWGLYATSANRAGILSFMRIYLSPMFGPGDRGLAAAARERVGNATKLDACITLLGAGALATSAYCAVASIAVARAVGALSG